MYSDYKFTTEFSKKLLHISEEDLAYVNEVINITRKRLDKQKNLEEETVHLSMKQLQSIQRKAFALNILEEKGITVKNYGSKIEGFKKFKKKALEEYGIYIQEEIPYFNPSYLYNLIDVELCFAGLSTEQRNNFYLLFTLRDRIPSQDVVREGLDSKVKFNLLLELGTLNNNDLMILKSNKDLKNHQFHTTYYALLEKYNITEIPHDLIEEHCFALEINDTKEYNQFMKEYQINSNEEFSNISFCQFEFGFIKNLDYGTLIKHQLENDSLSFLEKIIKKYELSSYPEILTIYNSKCK